VRRVAPALGPLWLSALTVALGLPALTWPANTLDEMILLVYPMRMLDGDLPYRDFFAAYGPAHWWFLEGTYALLTPTVLVARLLGLAIHVLLVLGLYRLLCGLGRAQAVLAGSLAALLMFRIGDAPYAWISSAAACVWALSLIARSSVPRWHVVAAGVLGGLAVSIRPDVALLALLPALPLVRRCVGWRPWAVGLVVGGLPLLASVLITPSGFLHDVVLGRAGRGAAQSRLPLWPPEPMDQAFLLALAVAILLLVTAAAVRRTAFATSMALLAVLAVPQALQRLDRTHLVYVGILCLPLLPQALGDLLGAVPPRLARPPVLGALLATLLFLLGAGIATVQPVFITAAGDGPDAEVVRHDGRTVPELPARAAALKELLPVLDRVTKPGQRLFVFDSDLVRPAITDVGLYFLMPSLRSSGFNLEVTPGLSSASGSRLDQDVAEADVIVLLEATPAFRAALFPYERDGARAAAEALHRDFCLTTRVRYYQVWLRC